MQNFCSVSWDPDDKNTSEIPTEIQIAYSRSGKNIQQYLILIVWVPLKPFPSKKFFFSIISDFFYAEIEISTKVVDTINLKHPTPWSVVPLAMFLFLPLLFHSHESRCVEETLMTERNPLI